MYEVITYWDTNDKGYSQGKYKLLISALCNAAELGNKYDYYDIKVIDNTGKNYYNHIRKGNKI